MTDTELAWLAGWLEGEGTFFCHTEKPYGKRKSYRRLTVRASSVDEETIIKVQSIAGGRKYGPYKYSESRQPHWQWGISGKQAASEFMLMIRPHMGTRRQAQIDKALREAMQHN